MAYRKVIRINPFSKKSIDAAIKELKEEEKEILKKYDEFLLDLGVSIETYLNAEYNSKARGFNDDYEVDVDPSRKGLVVKASGTSVAFIEFGAGIYAGDGQYEHPHEKAFYPGSWSEEHANTYWVWEHSNTPNIEYRWNQQAVHGFDGVINNMHRWIKEAADEVFK